MQALLAARGPWVQDEKWLQTKVVSTFLKEGGRALWDADMNVNVVDEKCKGGKIVRSEEK